MCVGATCRSVMSFMVDDLCRGWFKCRGREVTGSGAHRQMSMARRDCFHLYDSICSVALSVRGDVGDGVLVADVASNALADGRNVFECFWQKCLAARCLRKPLEDDGIAIGILVIEDADRVDNYAWLADHGHDFGQLVFAGVVASIADYDQHFLVPIPLLQVFESDGNRVV